MRYFSCIHTGEIVLEAFLKPMGLGRHRPAKDINVQAIRTNKIYLDRSARIQDGGANRYSRPV